MADLSGCHLLIRRGCANPRLLPPHEKRDWDHINEKCDNCAENVEVLHAHAIDPGSQDEENNEGDEVPHEDDTDQGITNNLSYKLDKVVQY